LHSNDGSGHLAQGAQGGHLASLSGSFELELDEIEGQTGQTGGTT
jgi:hypothetical protein